MNEDEYEDRIHELLGFVRRSNGRCYQLNQEWIQKYEVTSVEQKEILYQIAQAIRHWHRNTSYCVEFYEELNK